MPRSSKDIWKQGNFRISEPRKDCVGFFRLTTWFGGFMWDCQFLVWFLFFLNKYWDYTHVLKSFNFCKLHRGKISSAQNNNWKPMAKWIPFRPQRLDDSLWGGQGEKCSSLWHKDAKVDVKTTCLPLIFTHLFKLMRLYLGKGNEIHPQTVHSFILTSGKLLLIKNFLFFFV